MVTFFQFEQHSSEGIFHLFPWVRFGPSFERARMFALSKFVSNDLNKKVDIGRCKTIFAKSGTCLAIRRCLSLGSFLTMSRALSNSTSSGFRSDAICSRSTSLSDLSHLLQMAAHARIGRSDCYLPQSWRQFPKSLPDDLRLCTVRRTWHDGGSTMKICGCRRDVVVAGWFGLKAFLTIDAAGFWYRDR
jgi:hypothetical protein